MCCWRFTGPNRCSGVTSRSKVSPSSVWSMRSKGASPFLPPLDALLIGCDAPGRRGLWPALNGQQDIVGKCHDDTRGPGGTWLACGDVSGTAGTHLFYTPMGGG